MPNKQSTGEDMPELLYANKSFKEIDGTYFLFENSDFSDDIKYHSEASVKAKLESIIEDVESASKSYGYEYKCVELIPIDDVLKIIRGRL